MENAQQKQFEKDIERYPKSKEFFSQWIAHLSSVDNDNDDRKTFKDFFGTFYESHYDYNANPAHPGIEFIRTLSVEWVYHMALRYTEKTEEERKQIEEKIQSERERLLNFNRERQHTLRGNIYVIESVWGDASTMIKNLEGLDSRKQELTE